MKKRPAPLSRWKVEHLADAIERQLDFQARALAARKCRRQEAFKRAYKRRRFQGRSTIVLGVRRTPGFDSQQPQGELFDDRVDD